MNEPDTLLKHPEAMKDEVRKMARPNRRAPSSIHSGEVDRTQEGE